jgi:hypothetical protein
MISLAEFTAILMHRSSAYAIALIGFMLGMLYLSLFTFFGTVTQ